MALALVPIIGAVSMGVEASTWFFMGRAAQNAADSAAVAAADNGAAGGSGSAWLAEGRANARTYGFTDGSNNVTVSVVNGVTCPDGTAVCYQATVTKVMPIYMTRVVGYNGDTSIGTQRAKTITSVALAEATFNSIAFASCISAVGSDTNVPKANKTAISGDGTPAASGPGCSLSAVGPSPSSIGCTGSNGLGANYGFATGTISGSGNNNVCVTSSTLAPSFVFCDPFAASPASGCAASTYASAVSSAVSSAPSCTATPTTFASPLASSACYNTNFTVPGDLTGPSSGAVIVLTNGANLDMNGHSATNVTFIFTQGTASAPGSLTGQNSSVSISAPATGSLSGIAVYQMASSSCTQSNCDNWTVTGSRTIDITGLIYLPYTNASFGGSVNTTSTGKCFISVFNSLAVNGTGYVLDRSGCSSDGLNSVPTVLRYRAALVK
jgi:hypothetical protein